jgi:hypothetical protein
MCMCMSVSVSVKVSVKVSVRVSVRMWEYLISLAIAHKGVEKTHCLLHPDHNQCYHVNANKSVYNYNNVIYSK